MRDIRFSQSKSVFNRIDPPQLRVLPRSEFVKLITTHYVGKKETASVWMPAIFSQPTRRSDVVQEITLFVVDSDSLTESQLRGHIDTLKAAGHSFLVHSSFGYDPPKKAKARFVFFPDREIEVGNQFRWRQAIWPRLMTYFGFDAQGADQQCKNADRAYYMPIIRNVGVPRFAEYHEGKDFSVDEVLGDILKEPLERYNFNVPYESEEDPDLELNLQDIADRLLLRFGKGVAAEAIKQVLAGEATAEGQGRHAVISIFTWALAHIAEPQEASEHLVKVMEPWCDAMEFRYGQRGAESWEREALRLLIGARAKKPTWDAIRAKEQSLLKLFDSSEFGDV